MKKILQITLVFFTVLSLYLIGKTSPVSAATNNAKGKTLKEYEDLVEKYKNEAAQNKANINKTQDEINAANNQIEKLKQETLTLTKEISTLNDEIEEYQGDIKEKITESKQVIEYMQLSADRNVYLDYIFKADSVTDLINREYVIQEIVDYNDRAVDELKQMVADNEAREKEIEKRQKEIDNKENQLEKQIESLGDKKSSLAAGGVSIEKQLKLYEEYVSIYRKLGCKSTDVIGKDCAKEDGITSFRRPTTTGYITQEAYYGKSYTHKGIDIGSPNKYAEKIYPIADGTITSKYTDSYGALTVVILHYNILDGKYYSSLYCHMSAYAPNIYVGKKVTSNDYIGYMGMTGKATGPHLHLEVYPCKLYNPSDSNCYSWSAWASFGTNKLKNGYNPRQLINFPKGLYNYWYSR